MANPLMGGNLPQNNNPINGILQMMNGNVNPEQLLGQLAKQNPQAYQAMEQLKNTSGGKNPKDLAMQLAKQKGIDPNQIMQIARKMGLK